MFLHLEEVLERKRQEWWRKSGKLWVEVSLFLLSNLFFHCDRPYLEAGTPSPQESEAHKLQWGRRGQLVRKSTISLPRHLLGKYVPLCSRLAHSLSSLHVLQLLQ